jgi:glycosyltransferase involved in cell wall biosynthesis
VKQLHICFLCNEYPPGKHGGIGIFTQTLGRRLAARGHKVTVVGFYPVRKSTSENDDGVSIRRLRETRLPRAGFVLNGLSLRRNLRELDSSRPVDVLDGPENAFALLPKDFPGLKVIRMNGGHHFFYTCLGKHPRAWRSWLERRSFARAQSLCGVSRFVAEETRRLLCLGDVQIEILPNPIDTNRFRPMPEIPVVPGRIVFVGTLCEKKGIRQLILAMPEILAAFPQAHLLAIGRDSRDPDTGLSYMDLLEATVAPGARGRITFKDHVDNEQLPRELAAAQVLVYPSHMEAQGIVVVEGMAMARPVVASRTGPGPELLEHGRSGLLCDPYDPHSIAEAINRVLKNPGWACRAAEAARVKAVQDFSVEMLVVKNEQFFSRCLERKQGC